MKEKLMAMLLPAPSALFKQGSYWLIWLIITTMIISVATWRFKSRLLGLSKKI